MSARSNAEEHIFRVAEDFVDWVTILSGVGCVVHALCVMPTHYHLLGSFEDEQLVPAIHRLNRRYASRFNKRHCRRGKVFDTPFASVPVESQGHLTWLVRYIAQNPAEPTQWLWSSFVTDLALVDDSLLVDVFGGRDSMLRYAFDETHELSSLGTKFGPPHELSWN